MSAMPQALSKSSGVAELRLDAVSAKYLLGGLGRRPASGQYLLDRHLKQNA